MNKLNVFPRDLVSSWNARGSVYYRLATATSVAICVVAEGAPLRDRSCGSLMEAAQVEVYSVDRKGYESFIAYAEGAQKLRLLEAFKNNWG